MAITTFVHDKDKGAPVPGWPDVVGYSTVTYEGAVLSTGERNGYDDSDFYADVWDEASGSIKRIDYATTRGWTYLNGAAVDATPEVIEKANAYARARALDALKAAAAEDARTVAKGKRVKVVKGRKVPKGTEGTVFWMGKGRAYSYSQAKWGVPDRVGFKGDDGVTYWTAASNLEVTDPEEWVADLSDIEARAARVDWTYIAHGAYLAGLSRSARAA